MSGAGIRAPKWITLLFYLIIYTCASNSAFMLCEDNVSSVEKVHPGAKCPPKMEQFGGSVSALHFCYSKHFDSSWWQNRCYIISRSPSQPVCVTPEMLKRTPMTHLIIHKCASSCATQNVCGAEKGFLRFAR